MTLQDVFNAMPKPRNTIECFTCQTLSTMAEADKDFLNALLENRDVYSTTISKALDGAGYKVGTASVKRHRAGDCAARRNVG